MGGTWKKFAIEEKCERWGVEGRSDGIVFLGLCIPGI